MKKDTYISFIEVSEWTKEGKFDSLVDIVSSKMYENILKEQWRYDRLRKKILKILDTIDEGLKKDRVVYELENITFSDLFEKAVADVSDYEWNKMTIILTLKVSPYFVRYLCETAPSLMNGFFSRVVGKKVELDLGGSLHLEGAYSSFPFNDKQMAVIVRDIGERFVEKYGDIVNNSIESLSIFSTREIKILWRGRLNKVKDLLMLYENPYKKEILSRIRNCGEKTSESILEKMEKFVKTLPK